MIPQSSSNSDCIAEIELLGIPFATLDFMGVVKSLISRPASNPFTYVATPNAQHLVLLRRGVDGFEFGLSRAWFLTCDSQVVRRLGRLLFHKELSLVTGSDLTMHLLRHIIDTEEPITIIGGSKDLKTDLARQYGLQRIALYSPPFGFSSDAILRQKCVDFVQNHPARFIFLACGAPQSEVLAAHIVDAKCATGIGLCIGASMLFATGQLKRAPLIWQKLGLEWLYRLKQEPRRLVRRFWQAQLPILRIAAFARISRQNQHLSILKRQ